MQSADFSIVRHIHPSYTLKVFNLFSSSFYHTKSIILKVTETNVSHKTFKHIVNPPELIAYELSLVSFILK